ncbi:ATP-grasp domain-containing protein [Puniceicoccaceae bacterium K14]|nr:ATP-grasp domain-containing protein [Puniceicoccaceae bacterium K14]
MQPKNILLLSAGNKVALVKIAKQAALELGATLHVSDTRPKAPALTFTDKYIALPNFDTDYWIQTIIEYSIKNGIGLILPTRHSELHILDTHRSLFKDANIKLIISSSAMLSMSLNKLNTAIFFQENQIPSPNTYSLKAWQEHPIFPAIAKPISGSGSQSIYEIVNTESVPAMTDGLLVQEKALGIEYTVNAYINREEECICTIPHRRIFVEQGEVMQAETERVEILIQQTQKIIKSAKGFVGPVNIQAFYEASSNSCQFIEINPRIGGGFPLAHQAGGHFIHWLCREYMANETIEPKNDWTENLTMMRYREAIFY